MAYTAYEESAGKALDGVEALCKHLTASGSFSSSTQPTLAEVEDWLTEGWRQINIVLADYGYAVPADPDDLDADARGVLQKYNVWWACAQAEYSQASAGYTAGSGSRGDLFTEMFWGSGGTLSREGMPHPGIRRTVESPAFQRLGHTKQSELSAHLAVGGISKGDKRTIDDDSDFTGYAFRRGQFKNPGAETPWSERGNV